MQEIKWGLIGCGDIARKRVIPALQNAPGSKLVAVARKNAAKVEECAKEFGVEKWYENPDDLIQDPDIDAVYLATPVFRHMPDILAAAAAGKHVLCEKPLALNPDDCQTIIDVTRKAGITFGVAYYRRFYPSVLAVRNYLTKGSLGHIVNIEFRVNDLHDPTGNWAGREWFFNKAQAGGGCLMDFGCHRLDLCEFLLGMPDSLWGSIDAVRFDTEVEDRATVLLYYENGIQVSLHLCGAVDMMTDTFDIYGTEGTIQIPNLNEGRVDVTIDGKTVSLDLPPHDNLHQPLVEDFCDAIREKRDPACTGEAAAVTNQMIDAVYSGQEQ